MKQKQQVLFLGRFFPNNLLKTIKEDSFGRIGFSNHNFEMSIISGLRQQSNLTLRCLSVPTVYSYPKNNQRFYIYSEEYNIVETHTRSIGFCNVFIINKIWILLSLIYNIVIELKYFKNKEIDIIINTPSILLLLSVFVVNYFSRKKITTTLIVPDIPQMISDMDKYSFLKRNILKIMDNWSMKLAAKCNYFVLLTDAMTDFFKKSINYIVMEGIIDTTKTEAFPALKSDKKIILYTGTLRRIFGILNLVDAFERVSLADTELWICGSGDSENEIREASKRNPNIIFFGLLDTGRIKEIQNYATVLVNPRTSQGEYTKYSFPSKTLEYLLTGKPVIMNKLPGIPSEYYDFLFIPSDESVDALSKTLIDVLCMNPLDRENKALKGKEFVLSYKNSKVQVSRILKMIRAEKNGKNE